MITTVPFGLLYPKENAAVEAVSFPGSRSVLCPVPAGTGGFRGRDVAALHLALTVLMVAVRWGFRGDGRHSISA